MRQLLDLIFDSRAIEISELSRAFNPFRVLGVETYEIRHANTLAWLLSPTESHGLGDTFARQFLKIICDREQDRGGRGEDVLARIARYGLNAIHVQREVTSAALESLDVSEADAAIQGTLIPEGNDNEKKAGYLDVLIEGDGWVVGIEAKVKSKQHSDQLGRYQRSLEKGAPKREKVLVFLTNDSADESAAPWNLFTWDDLVAQPLREILELVPVERRSDPQSAFLLSFLEVLDENCQPPKGRREELLTAMASDYKSFLNSIRGRRNGGNLSDEERDLVRLHSSLINELAKRFESPIIARGKILEELIRSDNRFVMAPSSSGYVRFVLKEWAEIPWMVIPKRMGAVGGFAVTCEVINSRDHGLQFKLMLRDLGVDDQYLRQRKQLLKAVQDAGAQEMKRYFPNVFTRSGLATGSNRFFGMYLSARFHADDVDSAKRFLSEECISSILKIDEFIRVVK